jgi:ubiquinone/menaquinone biosynthesis C-methylase UbiE
MQFAAPAEQYDRFMGRYTPSLAVGLADLAGIEAGVRVVDVGCGPGGLTSELVARTGASNVAAIDPAPQFAAACRERHPGADVREGAAEALPWEDGTFDAALACLVVAFMADPDQGLREMARVTRPGGVVAACMWDLAEGGMTMLKTFWSAAKELHPGITGEHARVGVSRGDIAERLRRAGLQDVREGELEARVSYSGFDDFWEPFTFAVGPAGAYLASLAGDDQARMRELLRARMPEEPFELTARAWYARGLVG